jgi:hypothetical protein
MQFCQIVFMSVQVDCQHFINKNIKIAHVFFDFWNRLHKFGFENCPDDLHCLGILRFRAYLE